MATAPATQAPATQGSSWGWVPAAAQLGLGLYQLYQNRRSENRAENIAREAEDRRYAEAEDAAAEAEEASEIPTVDPAIIREAMAVASKNFAKARSVFEPYHQQAQQLMPDVINAYKGGLTNMSMLSQYLSNPNSYQQQQKPLWQMPVYLPKR